MPGNRDKRNYGIVCKTDGALLFAVDLEVYFIIFISCLVFYGKNYEI